MKLRFSRIKRYITLVAVGIYLALVIFALFNYRSRCVYTMPEMLLQQYRVDQSTEGKCDVDLDKLGIVTLDIINIPTFEEIAISNPHVEKGGRWKPSGCESWQKVAIVIPYRNRLLHLKLLLNRLHNMLKKQKLHYRIFVIEQAWDDKFNRGKLMNIGYLEALKYDNYDCFVFQDADLLPENDKNLYMCDRQARHLASAIDEMRYHVMYYNYAGGVVAINTENIRRINGFSNSYWGWGNEDDDLSARTQEVGMLLTRPPEYIGRFTMVRHAKALRAEHGNDLFLSWRARWMLDGLNNAEGLNYTVVHKTDSLLYTNITVDIGPAFNNIIAYKYATKETIWWFLKFYYP